MLKNFKITFIAIFYVFMVVSSAANDNGEGILLHASEQALRDEQPAPDDEHEDALARYFNEALLIDEYEDDDPLEIFFEEAIANRLESEARRRRFLRGRITRRFSRDHSDAFQMDPEAFRKLYRYHPNIQVLITLRFLAESGFQKGVGQDYNHPVSKSRVSYIVNRVITAILTLKDDWIVFPNNRESRLRTQAQFLTLIRIPGILAAIDGFLIRLRRPRDFPEAYWSYREGSSVNVQLACIATGYIVDIRVVPGSNNDQNNWLYSELRDVMLGDSGYGSSIVLLTPVENAAENSPEAFRSRQLFYSAEIVAKIVTASAILHNFRKAHGMPDFEPPRLRDDEDDNDFELVMDEALQAGLAERQFIIDLMYSQDCELSWWHTLLQMCHSDQKISLVQKMCIAQYMLDNPDYAANVKDARHSKALETLVNSKEGPTRTQTQIKRARVQTTIPHCPSIHDIIPSHCKNRIHLGSFLYRPGAKLQQTLLKLLKPRVKKILTNINGTTGGRKRGALQVLDPNQVGDEMKKLARMHNYSFEVKNNPVATKVPPPSDKSRTGLAEALGEKIDSSMNEVLEEIDSKVADLKEYMRNKLLSVIDEEIGECIKHSHEMFKRDLSQIHVALEKLVANTVQAVDNSIENTASIQRPEVQNMMKTAASKAVNDWYGSPPKMDDLPQH
ncbi:hypothetical protein QAD02_019671 [Eretmocerus hayati]|uniref:Uncharacterized protein n=1 Tax=Eretmocerus hayati TaxID=131215 RepID=A0ACC2PKT7_9HYME|nr:hypothetical protein QAD02_019671 [Eretmocerus hayati]